MHLGAHAVGATARGGLVLLEVVDEKAYRIDSYRTHLRRTGLRSTARQGSCSGGGPTASRPMTWWPTSSVFSACRSSATSGLGTATTGSPALGVLAELDTDVGKLTLDQPALV